MRAKVSCCMAVILSCSALDILFVSSVNCWVLLVFPAGNTIEGVVVELVAGGRQFNMSFRQSE